MPIADADVGSGRAALPDLDRWTDAFARRLADDGWHVQQPAATDGDPVRRLVVRAAASGSDDPPVARSMLMRPPIDAPGLHPGGLRDELAEAGILLFALSLPAIDGRPTPRVDLPLVDEVARFERLLEALGNACAEAGVAQLVLAGYPPPVDASVELTSITPDPAVIEINAAPSADATEFLQRSRRIYAAAAAQGLDPYRLYYNGVVADSGGAGQITIGGPSPQASPFVVVPLLLPRLVRYANRHPALSYLFSHDFVGASGQSVRADERGIDAFDELVLALDLIDRQRDIDPGLLWHGLASFLADAAGNSHRAELNIEKLCNPFLPGRGSWGWSSSVRCACSIRPSGRLRWPVCCAAWWRCWPSSRTPNRSIDWGRELHERFALPYFLERDLAEVFDELDAAGLGLGCGDRVGTHPRRVPRVGAGRAARLHAGGSACARVLAAARRCGEPGAGRELTVDRRRYGTRRVAAAAVAGCGVSGAGVGRLARLAGGVHGSVGLPCAASTTHMASAGSTVCATAASFPPGACTRHWRRRPRSACCCVIPNSTRAQIVTLHEWRADGGAYDGLPRDLD